MVGGRDDVGWSDAGSLERAAEHESDFTLGLALKQASARKGSAGRQSHIRGEVTEVRLLDPELRLNCQRRQADLPSDRAGAARDSFLEDAVRDRISIGQR